MAIPALAGFLLAVMALLLIYGLEAFSRILQRIFNFKIPLGIATIDVPKIIGNAIAILQVYAQIIVGDLIRPVVNFILAPVFAIINLVQSMLTFADEAVSTIGWLADYVAPTIVARLTAGVHLYYGLARAYAAAVAANALHEAQHLYNLARAGWVAADTVVLHSAEHLYNLAIRYTNAALRDALGQAANVLRLVDAKITNAEKTMVAYAAGQAASALGAAKTYAVTAATTAVGTLTTDVGNALAPVATGLIDDVGQLEGILATDFPDIGALVRSIDLTRVGELAGGLVGTMTMVRALTRLAEQCTVPNCRNLSQYGRELQSLLSFVGDASLLAFLAELIHDPQAGAGVARDLFGPIANGAIATAREMVGV